MLMSTQKYHLWTPFRTSSSRKWPKSLLDSQKFDGLRKVRSGRFFWSSCKTTSLCQPPRPEGIYVNPTIRLAIEGSCDSGCEGDDSNLLYNWELRTMNCSLNVCVTSSQPIPFRDAYFPGTSAILPLSENFLNCSWVRVRFGSSCLAVGLQQKEISISQEFFAYIKNQGTNRFDVRFSITLKSTGVKGFLPALSMGRITRSISWLCCRSKLRSTVLSSPCNIVSSRKGIEFIPFPKYIVHSWHRTGKLVDFLGT